MNINSKKELMANLSALSAYYQNQLPDLALRMYVEDLSDLELDDVLKACHSYRMNPKNFRMPLPAQIREIIKPSPSDDNLSRELAARILQAVDMFGYTWPEEAKNYIGEIGWSVVRVYGGWQNMCESLGVHISMDNFNAQCRELCKGRIAFGESLGDKVQAIPYKRDGETAVIEYDDKNKTLGLVKSLVDGAKKI